MKPEARRVGRYEIVRIIGRGGMATVYLARQTDLDRDVALKRLMLFDGADPQLARRFLHEARLAGSFSHPNIVTVHEYLEHDGTPYIAMEYLARGSLRPYVGRMSLAQVAGVLEGVLAGLAHAEEHAVVHRDLKPENIMVTSQGGVKIADFGIAKATSATHATANLTTTGTTLGTPRYMSPERAMGQAIGPWSDLYSVGAIAFELLVGQAPFSDTEAPMAILLRQINEPVPPVVSLVPDVDPELSGWIERLLEKDPQRRTPSAATAADELDGIVTDVLGARWRRAAALPSRPGAPTVTLATRSPARPAAATPPAARAPAADGGTAAATPPTARVPAADRGTAAATPPTARVPAADRGAAAPVPAAVSGTAARTVAPVTRRRRERRRRVRPVRLAAALAAVIAVAAVAQGGLPAVGGGGARDGTIGALRTSMAADRRALTSATSPDERADRALALAERYEQAAEQLPPRDQRRAKALGRAARAYRAAADAVRREDGSDYDDALARAAAAEAALNRRHPRADDADENEPDEDDNGD